MSDPSEAACASVVLDADNLAARVVIEEATDSHTLSVHLLVSLARERGIEISPGVEAALAAIVERFTRQPEAINEVFARATPPTHGTPGSIEWVSGCDPENPEETPTDAGGDQVDYYNRQTFVRVHKEDHVATIHAPTHGIDGRDVTGKTLSASEGKPLALTLDPSLLQLGDGRILAQIDGLLVFNGKKLKVDPVLEIQGTVDFSTGNIDFEGDVVIHHDIRDKFRVNTTGSVTIHGLIDASHIDCGGELHARRGVAGRGEGTLEVGGDAHIGYLDQVTGHVGGSLHFTREIMHCTMSIGENLVTDTGSVIGGRLTIAGDARVADLGSESETPTELLLTAVPDQDSPAGAAAVQIKTLLQEVATMEKEMETLKATAGPHNPTAAERMTELTFEVSDANSKVLAITREFPMLAEVEDVAGCDSTLEVLRQIHGRVTVTFGQHTISFGDTVKGPVKLWLEGSRELMCQFGEGQPQPARTLSGVTGLADAA